MKKITIFFLLLAVSATTFSQQTTTTIPPLTKTDYLKKSKTQKTIGWVLLGAGTAMMVSGSSIWSNEAEESYNILYTTTKGTGLIAAGFIVAAGSIPLFIIAGKNKRRARAASAFLKMETVPVVQQTSFVSRQYPTLSIKISL